MSQHDLSIANQGFPAFRSDLNDALQALGSMQSGTSAPSTTYANMLWYDTTNNIVKMRNEDNDAWISLITLDQTNDIVAAVAATLATFVTLSVTGNATLGDASTDTLNVGNGDIFKDGSGNVGVGTISPTCKLDVVGGIQTSRTGVTSPASTDGNVFSGTYTPTLTNTTNVASSTASVCQYVRVGNIVTVSGQVVMNPTATGNTVLGISLPIASALSANQQVGGTAIAQSTTQAAGIYADTTNDRALFRMQAAATTALTYVFSFTYLVI